MSLVRLGREAEAVRIFRSFPSELDVLGCIQFTPEMGTENLARLQIAASLPKDSGTQLPPLPGKGTVDNEPENKRSGDQNRAANFVNAQGNKIRLSLLRFRPANGDKSCCNYTGQP